MVKKMLRYLEASNPRIAGATRDDAAPKSSAGATSSLLRLSILVGFGSGEAAVAAPGRSQRSFDAGAVGLGIVAAMSCGGGGGVGGAVVTKPGVATAAAAAAMARAEPIPIGRAAEAAVAAKRARTREEMELSESYTCVISHVGGNRVRKRVYFGNGYVGAFYDDVDDHLAGGATSADGEALPPPPPPPPGDFLSKCYLCKQKLDGLDVYMYRGEKAFCSAECRCQQMLTDECWENCGSIAMKSYENSPCSAPMKLFSSGVAVA